MTNKSNLIENAELVWVEDENGDFWNNKNRFGLRAKNSIKSEVAQLFLLSNIKTLILYHDGSNSRNFQIKKN